MDILYHAINMQNNIAKDAATSLKNGNPAKGYNSTLLFLYIARNKLRGKSAP